MLDLELGIEAQSIGEPVAEEKHEAPQVGLIIAVVVPVIVVDRLAVAAERRFTGTRDQAGFELVDLPLQDLELFVQRCLRPCRRRRKSRGERERECGSLHDDSR
ncbi:hypothetical protein D3C83_72970 [compost metagenome]